MTDVDDYYRNTETGTYWEPAENREAPEWGNETRTIPYRGDEQHGVPYTMDQSDAPTLEDDGTLGNLIQPHKVPDDDVIRHAPIPVRVVDFDQPYSVHRKISTTNYTIASTVSKPTQICSFRPERTRLTLQATTGLVFVAANPEQLTGAGGLGFLLVADGAPLVLETNGPIYVKTTAAAATVYVLEEYTVKPGSRSVSP